MMTQKMTLGDLTGGEICEQKPSEIHKLNKLKVCPRPAHHAIATQTETKHDCIVSHCPDGTLAPFWLRKEGL